MYRYLQIAAICLAVAAGCAPEPPPPAVVAVLMFDDLRAPILEGLREGLKDYGLLEGISVDLIVRDANGDASLLSDLAGELVSLRPAVLVALGGIEADAAVAAARGIGVPVVYIGVSSPVERGLAESVLEPLPNTTGVSTLSTEIAAKRLWWVRLLFPELTDVAVLYEPANVSSLLAFELSRAVAPRLGLTITPILLSTTDEIQAFADSLEEGKYQMIVETPSGMIMNARKDVILPAAMRSRIAFVGVDGEASEEGAVFSYGPDSFKMGVQGARLVERVLAGASPETLPIERAFEIDLCVNFSAARNADVTLPPQTRRLANVVYE